MNSMVGPVRREVAPVAPVARAPSWAMPPLGALNAFERAATHLSFRRAAEDLSQSPSAVSHQIRGLENYLGVRLFVRDARPVVLTAEGERYALVIRDALESLRDASRDLMRRGRGAPAELLVSALPFIGQTLILPHLGEFRARRPGVAVHVEASTAYADIAGGKVDVAIRLGREHSAGLRLEPLLDLAPRPVMSPALVKQGLTRPEDLAGHTLIHIKAAPDAWANWFRGAGLTMPEGAGEIWVETGAAALEAAEHGVGVALPVFPLAQLRPGFGQTVVAPFDIEGPKMTVYFVTRHEHTHDRRVEAFRAWLFEIVARVTGKAAPSAAAA